MSKAIAGIAMIGAAIGIGVLIFFQPELLATIPYIVQGMFAIGLGGISMEAGAIADALTSNRGQNITTRQAAGLRQIIYGMQRVGGTIIYQSTSGNKDWQMNLIIVLATHEIDSIENLYLDGRQVYWNVGSTGNVNRNGINFGGDADSHDHVGPGGPTYNFGTLVYCEARFGDQADGDVLAAVAGNDPNWTTAALGGPPWVGGCAYVYLKVVYHSVTLPTMPEIRFTVNGKNNIFDPRTGMSGYTQNWALIVADVLTDTVWGLGDDTVNQAQLIAAANVCDEQIETSQGAESNWAMSIHYDTSTSPGDALAMMMPNAAGRLSRIGGEWYIWPAYWQGPSFSFDQSALVGEPTWTPYRSFKDLFNRVNGTYIAPNYPYNVAGNLYDSNGWWNGTTQNNWPFAFQPTNYPQYAADVLHGYESDAYLAADGGNQLPKELALRGCLSVVQAQRAAKVPLLRNRYQGMGTFPMQLAAWQMTPTTVMTFTWPALNWTNHVLEIDTLRFAIEEAGEEQGEAGDGQTAMKLYVQASVIETGPDVYEWSQAEELTIYDVPVAPVNNAYVPQPPGSLTLASSSSTAIVGADGITIPRVQVSWTAPPDSYVTLIQTQYKLHSSLIWIDGGAVDVGLLKTYIVGVVSGLIYDFRIRSLRFNGATSVWVEDDSYTVSSVTSSISTAAISGLAPVASGGTLSAGMLSGGTVPAAVLPTALARLNAGGATGPTVAAGASAQVGSGATAAATGSGLAGKITLTTGTGTLTAGTVCTLTFPVAFATAPNGVCAANGTAMPGLGWSLTTGNLVITVATALAPSTAYTIEYSVS